jgi:hypothetical protein
MLKKKKLVSAVSAAALMLTSAVGMPLTSSLLAGSVISAVAADIVASGDCGDNATYTLDSDGNLVITGTGEIYDYSFYYDGSIKTVTIGEGITGIGSYAFFDCGNLETVTIPLDSELVEIQSGAFGSCSELKTITIPEKVESIGYDAFYGAGNVENVYCYVDPGLLEWNEGGCDDFKSNGTTVIHVPENCLFEYKTKFEDVVRGTFEGDLPNIKVKTHQSKKPTCVDDGNIEYFENTVSGKIYRTRNGAVNENADDLLKESDIVIPADGVSHSWSAWTKDNETGKQNRICDYCHKTEEFTPANNDPGFIVTIPASIPLDSSGKTNVYMDIRYYGISDNNYQNQPFYKKLITVKLLKINDKPLIVEDAPNPDAEYTLSDDHAADPVEYTLSVSNRDNDPFDPKNHPDSALLRAYFDYSSVAAKAEDSATLTFSIIDGENAAPGHYSGSLTFGISLEEASPDVIPNERYKDVY